MLAALWFMLVSKDWKTIFVFATIILYFTFIVLCTMPESPKFLLSQGRYQEARAVMTRIARFNKIETLALNEEFVGNAGVTGEANEIKKRIEYTCKWEQEVAQQVNQNNTDI